MIQCKELIESINSAPTINYKDGILYCSEFIEDAACDINGEVFTSDIPNKLISTGFFIEKGSDFSPSDFKISIADFSKFLPFVNLRVAKVSENPNTYIGKYCISSLDDKYLTPRSLLDATAGTFNPKFAENNIAAIWRVDFPILPGTADPPHIIRFCIDDLIHTAMAYYRNAMESEDLFQFTCNKVLEIVSSVFNNLSEDEKNEGIKPGSKNWFKIMHYLFNLRGTYENIDFSSVSEITKMKTLRAPKVVIHSENEYVTLKKPEGEKRENILLQYKLRSQEQGIVPEEQDAQEWITVEENVPFGINESGKTYFDEGHVFVGQCIARTIFFPWIELHTTTNYEIPLNSAEESSEVKISGKKGSDKTILINNNSTSNTISKPAGHEGVSGGDAIMIKPSSEATEYINITIAPKEGETDSLYGRIMK